VNNDPVILCLNDEHEVVRVRVRVRVIRSWDGNAIIGLLVIE